MTILCYHSVHPTWTSRLAVTPDDFARHCNWLARRRRVLPLADALPLLDRNGRGPRGSVVLTFDDGFSDNYEHALPVLTRHRLPATVFLVAQTLTPEGRRVDWVDTPPPEPQRLTTLTRDQVLEMRAAGVDFQSHSYAHRTLTELGEAECVADLRNSREVLEDLLHGPVTLLAYPRGRHDERVRRAAGKAGYSHAFALPTDRERPGRYAIPRVGIYSGNGVGTVRVKLAPSYLQLRTHHGLRQLARSVPRALGRTG